MRHRLTSYLMLIALILQLGGGAQAIHALEAHHHDHACTGHADHDPANEPKHTHASTPGQCVPPDAPDTPDSPAPHDADDCSICLTLLHTTATPLDLARVGVDVTDTGRLVFVAFDSRALGRSIHAPTGRGPPAFHI